jgi:heme-degrading monooxygenase HmoA
MSEIAHTPAPPYYAVIFTSYRTDIDQNYGEVANRMVTLAADQPGFLGVESARDGLGITVSYWDSLEAIKNWKQNAEHRDAQIKGRKMWYESFKLRIAKVEKDYSMEPKNDE